MHEQLLRENGWTVWGDTTGSISFKLPTFMERRRIYHFTVEPNVVLENIIEVRVLGPYLHQVKYRDEGSSLIAVLRDFQYFEVVPFTDTYWPEEHE
jgi:hypothetical protein